MSIESEIDRIEDNIANAYDVMENAGAEMPEVRNSNNLTRTVINTVENSSNIKKYITNYMSEIPQDIKLEFNDGTLTLKAGSYVYKPNGKNIFDKISIEKDKVLTSVGVGTKRFLFIREDGVFTTYQITNCVSGDTDSKAGKAYHSWYDTDNNLIKNYNADSSVVDYTFSFPLGIISCKDGVITSLDYIFNGFGYIGTCLFGLPNIKGLYADGINTDGTLKNTEFALTKVCIKQYSSWGTKISYFKLSNNDISTTEYSKYTYDSQNNINYENNIVSQACFCGKIISDTNAITSFILPEVIRLVKEENLFISGNGAPTYNTIAKKVGTIYYDEDSKQTYTCIAISDGVNGTLNNIVPINNLLYLDTKGQNVISDYSLSASATNYKILMKLYQRTSWNNRTNNEILRANISGTYVIYVDTSAKLHLYNNGAFDSASTNTLPVDNWIWLKITYDGTNTSTEYIVDNNYTYSTLPSEGWTALITKNANLFGKDSTLYFCGNAGQVWRNSIVDTTGCAIFVDDSLEYLMHNPTSKVYAWQTDSLNFEQNSTSLVIDRNYKGIIPTSSYTNTVGLGSKNILSNNSVAVGYNCQATGDNAIAIGTNARCTNYGVAIGQGAVNLKTRGVAIGLSAYNNGQGSTQLGRGCTFNSKEVNISLYKDSDVGSGTTSDENYKLLGYDGTIPADRLKQSVLLGTVAPTTTIASSYIGQLYIDTVTNKIYRCISNDNNGLANFNIEGSLTFNNHDASEFSDNNYIKFPSNFLDPSKYRNFELQFAFTLTTTGKNQPLYSCATQYKSGLVITVNTSNRIVVYVSSNGTSYGVTITDWTKTIAANKKYIVKVKYDAIDGYTILIRDTTQSYYTYTVNSNTSKPYYDSEAITTISKGPSSGYYVYGTVHLDDCYIKLDDKKVWEPYSNYQWRELIENTATGTNSISLFGIPASSKNAINVGFDSESTAPGSLALGNSAKATSNYSIGINGFASALGSIVLGNGKSTERDTFKVALHHSSTRAIDESTGLYTLLNSSGKIPGGRMSLQDTSAPTTSTVGSIGQFYIDTANQDAYICVKADTTTPEYIWKKITA